MSLTFLTWSGSPKRDVRHVVARVGLSFGSQGVVDGFRLSALCGVSDDALELDFFSTRLYAEEACAACAKALVETTK